MKPVEVILKTPVTVEDSMAIAKAITPLFGVPPVGEND